VALRIFSALMNSGSSSALSSSSSFLSLYDGSLGPGTWVLCLRFLGLDGPGRLLLSAGDGSAAGDSGSSSDMSSSDSSLLPGLYDGSWDAESRSVFLRFLGFAGELVGGAVATGVFGLSIVDVALVLQRKRG
jgi:hypothetical protein